MYSAPDRSSDVDNRHAIRKEPQTTEVRVTTGKDRRKPGHEVERDTVAAHSKAKWNPNGDGRTRSYRRVDKSAPGSSNTHVITSSVHGVFQAGGPARRLLGLVLKW